MVDRVGDDVLTTLAEAAAQDDPLTALAATGRLRKELERREAVLVRRARNAGTTWAEIAAVLNVSKQAVHKKYGGRGLFGGKP
jgi:DNA invertase Pin-like site-specific DNA recombinase